MRMQKRMCINYVSVGALEPLVFCSKWKTSRGRTTCGDDDGDDDDDDVVVVVVLIMAYVYDV